MMTVLLRVLRNNMLIYSRMTVLIDSAEKLLVSP